MMFSLIIWLRWCLKVTYIVRYIKGWGALRNLLPHQNVNLCNYFLYQYKTLAFYFIPIIMSLKVKSFHRVWLFATLWTIAYQDPQATVQGVFQARVLEWVAIFFSRGSSRPRDRTWVSRIAGRLFTIWATGKLHYHLLWCSHCPWFGHKSLCKLSSVSFWHIPVILWALFCFLA